MANRWGNSGNNERLYFIGAPKSLQKVTAAMELRHLLLGRKAMTNLKESESEVAQLCPTLCNPVDCNLPGSSIHGILQTRILEWVAISFSRGSSQFRDQNHIPCIGSMVF